MESTFWVSAIVQYDKTSKPCLCAKSDGFLTLDSAKSEVAWMVANYYVLAIWIEEHDAKTGEKLRVAYHKCYLDCFGDIDNRFLQV